MPDYYVLVSTPDDGVIQKLCGHLWSVSLKRATEEANEYVDTLNGGWSKAVLLGKTHSAVASSLGTTKKLKGFSRFKTRRVTDRKWNHTKTPLRTKK